MKATKRQGTQLVTQNIHDTREAMMTASKHRNSHKFCQHTYMDLLSFFALGFWVDFRKSRFWVWVLRVAMILRSMAEIDDSESHQLSHCVASLITVFT